MSVSFGDPSYLTNRAEVLKLFDVPFLWLYKEILVQKWIEVQYRVIKSGRCHCHFSNVEKPENLHMPAIAFCGQDCKNPFTSGHFVCLVSGLYPNKILKGCAF